jgi:hypothetical protein
MVTKGPSSMLGFLLGAGSCTCVDEFAALPFRLTCHDRLHKPFFTLPLSLSFNWCRVKVVCWRHPAAIHQQAVVQPCLPPPPRSPPHTTHLLVEVWCECSLGCVAACCLCLLPLPLRLRTGCLLTARRQHCSHSRLATDYLRQVSSNGGGGGAGQFARLLGGEG